MEILELKNIVTDIKSPVDGFNIRMVNSNIELDSESLTRRGEFKPWWNLYLQHFVLSWASLVAQMVKYLPAM